MQKKKKQAVKRRYHDKNESMRQYSKKISEKSNIQNQKAKYQKNPEVQLTYKKCKHLEIVEMKKCYQKIKYESIPKIKEQYKKRYQENPELHEKIKKLGITNVKKRTKVVKAPITFAQYAIEACINLGANFLNMKHDKFSIQSCSIQ